MVTKVKTSATKQSERVLAESVRDSAQQIWQAGLGAFNKAQAEGSKAFESLVREGVSLQRRTQAAAEEKLAEASTRVSSMANEISSKASGQWDKLESIFEERVARALNKLGVPSAKDVADLIARMDALSDAVQGITGVAPVKKAPARKRPAAKAAIAAKRPVKSKPRAKAAAASA
jgi:poly(hydroxyalkanoate) granule-associated protein